MLTTYPACFFKEETGYSVLFADLPCATCGDTLDEAIMMGMDCLAGYIFTCREDGDPVPAPSGLSVVSPEAIAHAIDCEPGECYVLPITVDVDEYAKHHFDGTVPRTVKLPPWMDDAVMEQDLDLSAIIQDALRPLTKKAAPSGAAEKSL